MAEAFTASGAGAPTWRDYIMAGGHMVALRTAAPATSAQWGSVQWGSFNWGTGGAATTTLLYFTLDHLGSISVVTNAAGAVVERDSYDAWGKRRNPDGSAASCGTVTSATTRGFTGQEMMDSLCFINFNARIYDPSLGRFMSADPTTETVYNLQILNRYSYVGNNPLSLTDPTGLCFLGCFWKQGWFKAVVAIVIAIEVPELLESFEAAVGIEAIGSATQAALTAINIGIAGGISGYVTTGTFNGALMGALQADLFFAAGSFLQADPSFFLGSSTASTFIAHGLVGGLVSEISGGKLASGFLAAGVGSLADIPELHSDDFGANVAEHAVLGSVGSVLGGGKFENGAITGAFGYLFNNCVHTPGCTGNSPHGVGQNGKPLQGFPSDYLVLGAAGGAVTEVGGAIAGDIYSAGRWLLNLFSADSTITIDSKIAGQMEERGWTEETMQQTVNDPYATSSAYDRTTGTPATAYFNKDGSYVVTNDETNSVVQISNRNNLNWSPDRSITNPYKPQ